MRVVHPPHQPGGAEGGVGDRRQLPVRDLGQVGAAGDCWPECVRCCWRRWVGTEFRIKFSTVPPRTAHLHGGRGSPVREQTPPNAGIAPSPLATATEHEREWQMLLCW